MSVLIDKVVETLSEGPQNREQGKDGNWYFAKSLPYYSWKHTLMRVKDVWRVLVGKSIAVHYKRDE